MLKYILKCLVSVGELTHLGRGSAAKFEDKPDFDRSCLVWFGFLGWLQGQKADMERW